MRRHDELMERLAAADPVRDPEELTPEDQREADAMLARLLATPVEPAATPPRRARRRALAVAGAACAVLAGFAAVDLLDSDTAAPSVVDRAVAAVTRGGVYHVVELMTFRAEGAPGASRSLVFESWRTPDGRLHRKTFRVRDGQQGPLVEDFAGRKRAGRESGAALQWDPSSNTIGESGFAGGDLPFLGPFEDPGARLRTLRKQGRLRSAGTTTVDGKRAYRLVSGTFSRGQGSGGDRDRGGPGDLPAALPARLGGDLSGAEAGGVDALPHVRAARDQRREPRAARTRPAPRREMLPGCARAHGAARPRIPEPLCGRNPVTRSGQRLDQHAVADAADHEVRAGTPAVILVKVPRHLHPLHGFAAIVARR